MTLIKKTLFDEGIEKYNVFIKDTAPFSEYFKITELSDTFTGGKNSFLIQGSPELVADSIVKIQIKDSKGNIIYTEPGEGIPEYYEGTSKVVSLYIYPDTAFGPCTITILGELKEYNVNGIKVPIPSNWEGTYNVKWEKQINVNPFVANTTKIRFYKRPTVKITELLQPLYNIVSGSGLKVDSGISQSFAQINISNLETFTGDVKRVKVFRTSEGDISDYDLIQDVLLESKELLTTYTLSGSVIGNTGIFTAETLKNYWNTGSLKAELTSSRVESGLKLSGSGLFTYTQSLDISSTNTYELSLNAFYSASVSSNLGIYLSYTSQSKTVSSSIGTLYGITPTKNLSDTVIPFIIENNYPSASLYFSQSNGEWHLGNISLKLSEDTAFSPDSVSFITTMPTILGNDVFNFKFEFYDLNNNYVPVFVTQSATFAGASTTSYIISSSVSQSNSALYAVSSSISGTMTVYSSSANNSFGEVSGSIYTLSGSVSGSLGVISGSVYTLSGSVSGTIGALSSSISQSSALNLSASLSKVKLLADGGYPGTFIESSSIYSPNIAGINGYFSNKFQVGQTNPIVLDASTSTRKIYVGTGTFNNTNTSVYMDGSGQFSLKDKLNWNGTTLNIEGNVVITGGATKTAIDSKITGADVNANVTSISGGSITTGTVAANRIDVAGVISAGNIIVAGNNISSLTNNSGYQTNGDSKTGGFVGGWSIDANSIRGNNPTGGGDNAFTTNAGIILSSAGWISSKNFYINSSGDAVFRGNITATGGSFSGFMTAGTAKIGTDISGTEDGIQLDGNNYWYSGEAKFKVGDANNYLTWNDALKAIYINGQRTTGNYGALFVNGTNVDSTYGGLNVVDGGLRATNISSANGGYTIYANNNTYTGGEIRAGGNIIAYYSDERLKTKLGNINNAVDKLSQLNGFYYKNNEIAKSFGYTDEKTQLGLSAQEVQSIFPDIINPAPFDMENANGGSKSGENYLTLDYSKLVPVLVEAIKELKAEIEELKRNK
jgi:hypothetical protein